MGMGKGSRVSLTDLHKGTHNCAAAIRESGAGISPSNPPLVAAPFAPVSLQQPARSTSRRPPSTSSLRPAERGDGARALSQCAAIIFPHEWAAMSVVPGLVLRCFCCIFCIPAAFPSPSWSVLRRSPSPAASLGYIREKRPPPQDASISLWSEDDLFQGDPKGRYVSSLIEQLFSIENSPLTAVKRCSFIFLFFLNFSRLEENAFRKILGKDDYLVSGLIIQLFDIED